LTPVKTGISRSPEDNELPSSGHTGTLKGTDSQADSTSSILITRCSEKAQVGTTFLSLGLARQNAVAARCERWTAAVITNVNLTHADHRPVTSWDALAFAAVGRVGGQRRMIREAMHIIGRGQMAADRMPDHRGGA
jgi:hypothetical protein